MKKISTLHPGRKIGTLLARFHMTFFVVLVVGGLSYAVISINSLLSDPTIGSDYQSPINAGSIDQTTLNRINSLHKSNDPLPSPLPNTSRTNPFTE